MVTFLYFYFKTCIILDNRVSTFIIRNKNIKRQICRFYEFKTKEGVTERKAMKSKKAHLKK